MGTGRRFGRFGHGVVRRPPYLVAGRGAGRRQIRLPLPLIGLALVALFIATFVNVPAEMPGRAVQGLTVSERFDYCDRGQGFTCIIDGDTFRYRGQSIRIADINTPETYRSECAAEKALGDRATRRMQALLNTGPFQIVPYDRDEDRYGRKLRTVMRDGQSLGMILVAEGLAERWKGYRSSWCGR